MGNQGKRMNSGIGARVLRLKAGECWLCVPLDVVVGVFESDDTPEGLPIHDWNTLSGIDRPGHGALPPAVVAVRTARGDRGLAVDQSLGIREIRLAQSAPIPTRWTGPDGATVCHLLQLDDHLHFLLAPAALIGPTGVRAQRPEFAPGGAAETPARPIAVGE